MPDSLKKNLIVETDHETMKKLGALGILEILEDPKSWVPKKELQLNIIPGCITSNNEDNLARYIQGGILRILDRGDILGAISPSSIDDNNLFTGHGKKRHLPAQVFSGDKVRSFRFRAFRYESTNSVDTEFIRSDLIPVIRAKMKLGKEKGLLKEYSGMTSLLRDHIVRVHAAN